MVPIVPLILINGAEGIATGWATSIPLHHPLQVIDAVESLLRAPAGTGWEELPRLDPWFLGFKGRIEPLASGDGFETHGVITRVRRPDPGNRDKGKTRERMLTFHVTELPVGRWTEDFHKTLNSLCADNIVDSFSHNNTEATVDTTVHLVGEAAHALVDAQGAVDEEALRKLLRLTTRVSTRCKISLGGRVLVACVGAEKSHVVLCHTHISCRCLDDISKRYLDDIL